MHEYCENEWFHHKSCMSENYIIIWIQLYNEIPILLAEVREYCENERFHPECGENEAIIIRYARYGRMRSGGCIGDSASIGCSTDVRHLLDQQWVPNWHISGHVI